MISEETQETKRNELLIAWSALVGVIGAIVELFLISIQYLVYVVFGATIASIILGVLFYATGNDPNNPFVGGLVALFFLIPTIGVFVLNYQEVVRKRTDELSTIANRINHKYSHQHGLAHDKVQQLKDIVAELSLALNVKDIQLKILKSTNTNVLAVNENAIPVLFITNQAVLDLSRYELEAVIAVELLSLKVKYKQLQAIHKLCWQPFKEVFYIALAVDILLFGVGLYEHFSLATFLLLTVVFLVSIFILVVGIWFNYLYAQQMQQHLSFLNTQTLHLTKNPEALISAFQKLNDNQGHLLKTGKVEDSLWLKPIKANQYHWSLQKQIDILKQV